MIGLFGGDHTASRNNRLLCAAARRFLENTSHRGRVRTQSWAAERLGHLDLTHAWVQVLQLGNLWGLAMWIGTSSFRYLATSVIPGRRVLRLRPGERPIAGIPSGGSATECPLTAQVRTKLKLDGPASLSFHRHAISMASNLVESVSSGFDNRDGIGRGTIKGQSSLIAPSSV